MSEPAAGPASEGPAPRRRELAALALLFLRLGTTGFGGPAVHIAMMEDEVVRRRRWLSAERFLDLLGATNLIPGPNSTEMAIHIGLERAGWRGLLVAGTAFVLPAALITAGLAWAYVRYGSLPEATAVLYGIKPVIIAVVVQALWGLAPRAVRSASLGALGAAALIASALGVHELVVLFAAGALGAVLRGASVARAALWAGAPLAGGAGTALAAAAAGGAGAPFGLGALFLFFAKVGAVLFGSGYVLLAFLRADLVERWRWLSEAQLLDAVAVGQLTPGPLFTTATFIGYVLGGAPGALVATLGIFLPAFAFVALSGPLIPRMRRSAPVGGFLDGVNVASLALMAAVTLRLGRAALVDLPTLGLAAGAAVLLVRFRVSSAWLVLLGAAAGGAVHALR
jgi:chromate transporter